MTPSTPTNSRNPATMSAPRKPGAAMWASSRPPRAIRTSGPATRRKRHAAHWQAVAMVGVRELLRPRSLLAQQQVDADGDQDGGPEIAREIEIEEPQAAQQEDAA